MTDFNVEHHPQDNRFIINLVDGQIAQLRYRLDSKQDGASAVDFLAPTSRTIFAVKA